MVPGGGIEPPTRGFSIHWSNTLLQQQRAISNTLIMFVFQIVNNLLLLLEHDLYPRSPCSPKCRPSKNWFLGGTTCECDKARWVFEWLWFKASFKREADYNIWDLKFWTFNSSGYALLVVAQTVCQFIQTNNWDYKLTVGNPIKWSCKFWRSGSR